MPTDESDPSRIPLLSGREGTTGLREFGGFVREEFLEELKGQRKFEVFKEMSQNDAVVSGVLRAIDLLMRQVDWKIVPASKDNEDQRRAQFLDEVKNDMNPGWNEFISDVTSMATYGVAPHEMLFKRRRGEQSKFDDGMIGIHSLPIRRQETIYRWEFDEETEQPKTLIQQSDTNGEFRIPVDKLLLFKPDGARGNPEGSSILRNAYRSWYMKKRIQEIECYSDDTDILTKNRGWVGVEELSTNDKVATLNPENDEIEYYSPVTVHSYNYNGTMFHQKSRYVDLLVTPNHKVYNRPKYKDDFELTEAKDLIKVVAYKRSGQWSGKERDTFMIPGSGSRVDTQQPIEVKMDPWLEFLGFYLAEGWTEHSGNNKVAISQKEGVNAEWFRHVLDRLPFSYWTQDIGNKNLKFYISNRQLWDYLDQLGKAHEKYIPNEIKQCSKRQLRLLYEALLRGDGTSPAGTNQYITTSEQLKDDVSEIILKLGQAPNVSIKREASGSCNKNQIGETCRKCWVVTETRGLENGNLVNSHGKDERRWVSYDGRVYCPEMPQNHIVYVRRNGKSCWSGNSIGIERDLAGLPMAFVPPEVLSDDATDKQVAIRNRVETIVRNVRRDEQEGIVFPQSWNAEGEKNYDFQLLSSGGDRQFDTNAIIQRYDERIAMSALADFLLIGHEQVGSFALASSKTNLFSVALGAWLDIIQNKLNSKAVPTLFRLNGQTRGPYPKFRHGDVETPSLEEVGKYFNNLAKANFDFSTEEPIRDKLLDIANFPREEEGPPETQPERDDIDQPDDGNVGLSVGQSTTKGVIIKTLDDGRFVVCNDEENDVSICTKDELQRNE